MTLSALDNATTENFADRLLDILNAGALSLMVSIGHRSGLFDAMAAMPPADCEEIARCAGLDERYVREWLAAMVTGRIVTYHAGTETYYLPPAHAASLTRLSSPDNLAVMAQAVPFLGGLEDRILKCFKTGRGLTYDAYTPRFHQIMAEDSAQTVVAVLHEMILPLVPGLVARLRRGIDVLDIGCGAGRALIAMAEAFPLSRFFGYELCAEAVRQARMEIADRRLSNISVMRQDAATMPDRGAYDLVTAFDAIHDQADPAGVLAKVHTALREGGTFLMQDTAASSRLDRNLDHPAGPLLYAISTMHCLPVSLGYGGPGLGAMWGREAARAMLAEAGFDKVSVRQLPHDMANEFYVAPKLAAAND
ncbi:MAG: class I SAM-dependent methyltransferase [Alphaproteobacteria bacterium]